MDAKFPRRGDIEADLLLKYPTCLNDFQNDPVIFIIGRRPQQRTHRICHVTPFADDASGIFLCHMQFNNGRTAGDCGVTLLPARGHLPGFCNVGDQVFHNLFPLMMMRAQ